MTAPVSDEWVETVKAAMLSAPVHPEANTSTYFSIIARAAIAAIAPLIAAAEQRGREQAAEEVARLREALRFYATEWRPNMIGTGEDGSTYCFNDPTGALLHDAGDTAIRALGVSP